MLVMKLKIVDVKWVKLVFIRYIGWDIFLFHV